MRRRTLAVATVLATAGAALAIGDGPAARAAVPVTGDVNGDGRAELFIGVPFEDLGGAADTGALHVLAGTASGLRARGSQLWHQDVEGVADTNEAGDLFGTTFATGDFDDDSFADLAIGAPCETVGADVCSGAVTVLYGSPFGLTTDWSQRFDQDTAGISGDAEIDDAFGSALAAGDFDGDGRDDLVIGVPGEDVGAAEGAGAVYVLRGGESGLTTTGARLARQEAVAETSETGDAFGATLAVGDFDGDELDDLVIGAPSESGAQSQSGAVSVVPGSATGLRFADGSTISQDGPDVPGRGETGDRFGTTLAVGDFDGDGHDDLAVGAPDEALGAVAQAGALWLFEGSDDGVVLLGSRSIWQGEGMRGESETGDRLGAALAAADFDDDGEVDLAIGVPGETYGGFVRAGQVLVMRGTPVGINQVGTIILNQDVGGVADVPEDDDAFGASLAGADYDGDGRADLAVGVSEGFDAVAHAGGVHVFFGTATGFGVEDDQFFGQDSPSIADSAEASDGFGVVS